MQNSKVFADVFKDAQRERSEYVWSIISRLMATPRRAVQRKPTEDERYHPAPVAVAAHR